MEAKAKKELDDFFNKVRVKSGEYTHTGLEFPFGKFKILEPDLNEFYKLYNTALKAGVDIHLTECHSYTKKGTKIGNVIIDIDLKFNKKSARSFGETEIQNLVRLYTEEYQKLVHCTKKSAFKAFVFLREKPYIKSEDPLEVKDGIHIMFPFLITKGYTDFVVRKRVIDSISKDPNLFTIVGNINNLENTIDKAVIAKNNWLMYGSKKPRCAEYHLAKVLRSKGDSFKEYPIPEIDLAQLFSIRNAKKEHLLPLVDKESLKSFYKDPYFDDSRKKIKKTVLPRKRQEIDEDTLDLVKKITELLSPTRATNFDSWVSVGWALKNIDPSLEDAFVLFSSKTTGHFDEDSVRKHFRKFESREDGYNIGTLKIWAREDNPGGYQKITSLLIKDLFFKGLTCTHVDLARVIKEMYKDQFKCTNIEKQVWYEFRNHRWCLKMKGHSLWTKITTTITNEYMDMAKNSNVHIRDEHDPGHLAVQQAIKVATQLKNNTFINSVLSVCAHEFYDESFESLLDTKNHLIGFENGIYDLEKEIFREGTPEDYVSMTTGTNYIEDFKDDPEYPFMKKFFRQVFPDKTERKYAFRVLGSSLHGAILYELYHFWTGKGGNGKSTLFNFLEMALGMYYGKLSSSFWMGKNAASSQAQPELFATKNKRIVVSEEPEESGTLNSSIMKYYTGGDSVTTRGLFRDQITFVPQAKYHMMCNELPNINARDGGTWRRVRCIECKSKFVQNPNPANKNEFPVDFSLKAKMRKWVPLFASYLVKQCVSFLKESGLPKCESFERFTKQYQSEVDYIQEFMDYCVKPTEGVYTTVMPIRKVFTDWWKETKFGTNQKMPASKSVIDALTDRFQKTTKGFKGIQVGLNINVRETDPESEL